MSQIILYHAPFTCARVTMVALEETGTPYENRLVNLMKGEQKSDAYLSINPNGKVPTLLVDGHTLVENAAILLYLDARFPEAKLLPAGENPLDRAAILSDLIWCSSTLHPIVRQIRAPFHYTTGTDLDGVKAKGYEAFLPVIRVLEDRFAANEWWYGKQWSIIDPYLAWIYAGCASGGFDATPYPAVAAHTARVRALPAFQRTLEREAAAMAAAGMQLPPGVTL